RSEMDRGAPIGFVLPPPCQTCSGRCSSCSLKRKKERRQSIRRVQRQPKKYPAIGSAETSSWQFHRLTKVELQLVGKRPLSVVGNRGRFDHNLRLVWIDIKKGRSRQIA